MDVVFGTLLVQLAIAFGAQQAKPVDKPLPPVTTIEQGQTVNVDNSAVDKKN